MSRSIAFENMYIASLIMLLMSCRYAGSHERAALRISSTKQSDVKLWARILYGLVSGSDFKIARHFRLSWFKRDVIWWPMRVSKMHALDSDLARYADGRAQILATTRPKAYTSTLPHSMFSLLNNTSGAHHSSVPIIGLLWAASVDTEPPKSVSFPTISLCTCLWTIVLAVLMSPWKIPELCKAATPKAISIVKLHRCNLEGPNPGDVRTSSREPYAASSIARKGKALCISQPTKSTWIMFSCRLRDGRQDTRSSWQMTSNSWAAVDHWSWAVWGALWMNFLIATTEPRV